MRKPWTEQFFQRTGKNQALISENEVEDQRKTKTLRGGRRFGLAQEQKTYLKLFVSDFKVLIVFRSILQLKHNLVMSLNVMQIALCKSKKI